MFCESLITPNNYKSKYKIENGSIQPVTKATRRREFQNPSSAEEPQLSKWARYQQTICLVRHWAHIASIQPNRQDTRTRGRERLGSHQSWKQRDGWYSK